jgi:hypothetical protein
VFCAAAAPRAAAKSRAPAEDPGANIHDGMSVDAALAWLSAHGWRADPHGGTGPHPTLVAPAQKQWFESRSLPNIGCYTDNNNNSFCTLRFVRGLSEFAFQVKYAAGVSPAGSAADDIVFSPGIAEQRGEFSKLQGRLTPGMPMSRAIRIARAAGYRYQPSELLRDWGKFKPASKDAALYAWFHAHGYRNARCLNDEMPPTCKLELSPLRSADKAGNTIVLKALPAKKPGGEPTLIRAWSDRWYE